MTSNDAPLQASLLVKRFSVSIQPQLKMLRVNTGWGAVIDEILAKRGEDPISDDYYVSLTNVHSLEGNTGVVALNPVRENLLQVTATDVTFWRSAYGQSGHLSLDRSFEEFLALWSVVDEALVVRDVRHIDMCASLQLVFNTDADANAYMFKYIKRPSPINPRAFRLHYESRKWLKPDDHLHQVPQPETDAFSNESFTYYAGQPDMPIVLANARALGPAVAISPGGIDNKINVELNIQRYYAPLIASGVGAVLKDQFKRFHKQFDRTRNSVEHDLVAGGVVLDG